MAQAYGSDPGGKPIDPAKRVDEHFKGLHDWVTGTPERPAPMEAAIQKIAAVYANFNQVANAPNQGQALVGMIGGGLPAAARRRSNLQDLARSAPPALTPMLQPVASSAAQVTASGASHELSDAWRSKVVPLCETALNRYPLVRASATDVQLDDFVALLGPGGQIQKFFEQYLEAVRGHDPAAVEVAVGRSHPARAVAGFARRVRAGERHPRTRCSRTAPARCR